MCSARTVYGMFRAPLASGAIHTSDHAIELSLAEMSNVLEIILEQLSYPGAP